MNNRRIDCILRLLKKEEAYGLIATWLVEQKIVSLEDAKGQTRDQEKAEFIYFSLKKGEELEKLILVDYEWTILPLEQIKITCVTEREKKEFTFGH